MKLNQKIWKSMLFLNEKTSNYMKKIFEKLPNKQKNTPIDIKNMLFL